MASAGQIKYITDLADRRDTTNLDEKYKAWIINASLLNNNQVNEVLDALKNLPMPQSDNKVEVDKGRYFIVDPTDGVEKFVKVDKPEPPSKWAGYTFVSVQASDDFYPIRNAKHRDAILETIAEDPINAMNQYGIKLGVCGKCGRTLTQIDSRLRGMGPICAEKVLGVATDEEVNLLSELGLI